MEPEHSQRRHPPEGARSSSRRRLLLGVGVTGTAALAGCRTLSPFTEQEFREYACTDIDDEPTERYEPAEADLPFSFEKPEPMTRERVSNREDVTRLELRFIWTQPGRMGAEEVDHQVFLRLLFLRLGEASKTDYWNEHGGTVRDEIQYVGETTRIVERRSSGKSARFEVLLPAGEGDERVYNLLRIEAEAVLGGGSQEAQQRETDPAQTCSEAVRRVAMAAARSLEPL